MRHTIIQGSPNDFLLVALAKYTECRMSESPRASNPSPSPPIDILRHCSVETDVSERRAEYAVDVQTAGRDIAAAVSIKIRSIRRDIRERFENLPRAGRARDLSFATRAHTTAREGISRVWRRQAGRAERQPYEP